METAVVVAQAASELTLELLTELLPAQVEQEYQ
jgi:hypothetical protein